MEKSKAELVLLWIGRAGLGVLGAAVLTVVVVGGRITYEPAEGRNVVGDVDVPVASLSAYASVEATRVARMAYLMLGIGGEYSARCKSVYDSKTDKVVVKYSVSWRRLETPDTAEGAVISNDDGSYQSVHKIWSGANWGECIRKMMIWRGGE